MDCSGAFGVKDTDARQHFWNIDPANGKPRQARSLREQMSEDG
jgi:hypothetical protein